MTALGNPKLLERVSSGLVAIRNLFSQFDSDMNNVITREEFKAVRLCKMSPCLSAAVPPLPACHSTACQQPAGCVMMQWWITHHAMLLPATQKFVCMRLYSCCPLMLVL